jgi:hypothetical protein
MDMYGAFMATGFSFGNVWMRANCLEKVIALGATLKEDKHQLSVEALYDLKGKNKGFANIPLFFRLGSCYNAQYFTIF